MKKKIVSVLLCVVLTGITSFTGCQKSNDEIRKKNSPKEGTYETAGDKNSKYPEFITVDVFDPLANYQGIQSGWFAKIVKDKFNMELNIISPNVTGGETLFETRFAAGNLGDLVISGTEAGRFKNMVSAGLLMDMTDLLKNTNVLKNYETAITMANKEAGQEGIFAIPSEISVQSTRSINRWY